MTFYTLSKVNVLCGPNDHRIGVSRVWSYVNIIISSMAYFVGIYWISFYSSRKYLFILKIGGPLYVMGVILTIIFLHYDSLFCCCCDCCLGEEQVVIHDPSNPGANLVWKNGQVENVTIFLFKN